jgi:hypothetical protein
MTPNLELTNEQLVMYSVIGVITLAAIAFGVSR